MLNPRRAKRPAQRVRTPGRFRARVAVHAPGASAADLIASDDGPSRGGRVCSDRLALAIALSNRNPPFGWLAPGAFFPKVESPRASNGASHMPGVPVASQKGNPPDDRHPDAPESLGAALLNLGSDASVQVPARMALCNRDRATPAASGQCTLAHASALLGEVRVVRRRRNAVGACSSRD